MTSPNDIMNGKPVLPTAPKLIIRKSYRIQSFIAWTKEIFKKENSWQKYDPKQIPNNVDLALKWSNGAIVYYHVDGFGKHWLMSYPDKFDAPNTMGDPIKMLIIPFE